MNLQAITILIAFAVVGNSCGQNRSDANALQTKADTIQALLDYMEESAMNWRPEDEPWRDLSFTIRNADLTIMYGQQVIHPFLAEYKRRLRFIDANHQTDTLTMSINPGGQTSINVYFDPRRRLITMLDHWGTYTYDMSTREYTEKILEKALPDSNMMVGTILGKDGPLRFQPVP